MADLFLDSEFNSDQVLCFCVADDQGNRWEFDTRDGAGDLAAFVEARSADTWIAYAIQAEQESLLRLGIALPPLWIDLMAEAFQITMTHPMFRLNERVNAFGRRERYNSKAIGLAKVYNLFTGRDLDEDRKDEMRRLILSQREWSPAEWASIIAYCWSDVDALPPVWRFIRNFHARRHTQWTLGHALQRGKVNRCIADMMHRSSGFPVDEAWLRAVYDHRLLIIHAQVDELERVYRGYKLWKKTDKGATVNQAECRRYAADFGIAWQETDAGRLALSETFLDDFCRSCPSLRPFKETRDLIIQLAKNRWLDGDAKDFQPPLIQSGHVKAVSLPYYAKTGRSQPMVNRGHILNARPFIRTIIAPRPGKVIIACDWSQQEIAIALAFFPDARLRAAYETGDLYLAMAKMANAVPADATKKSHPLERQSFKAVQLGLAYGMKEQALGRKLYADLNAGKDTHVITLDEAMKRASQIVAWHKKTFADYWRGVNNFVRKVRQDGETISEDGWLYFADRDTAETQLQNLKMQSNGAAMMHLAIMALHEAGVDFLAEHHDALYVMADADDEERVTAIVLAAMDDAAKAVIGDDIKIKVDAKPIRAGEHYTDERETRMVDILNTHLNTKEAA